MQVDLLNFNKTKENNSPNIIFQKNEEKELEYIIKDKFRNSYIPKIHTTLKIS